MVSIMNGHKETKDDVEFKSTISFNDKSITGALAYIGTLGLSGGSTDPFAETKGGSTAAVLPPPNQGNPSYG